jgi:hypothetical protein
LRGLFGGRCRDAQTSTEFLRALSLGEDSAILILTDLEPGLWLGLMADRGQNGLNLAFRLMGSTLSELE